VLSDAVGAVASQRSCVDSHVHRRCTQTLEDSTSNVGNQMRSGVDHTVLVANAIRGDESV